MISQSTQITDTESQTISSETSTDGILSTADWMLNTTADFISASNQPNTSRCNTNFEMPIPQCCGPICACSHNVEGYVTDASTNAMPLVNVSVFVSGCSCYPFAISNENGYYEIKGICQDNSTLRFETEGYESQLEMPMTVGDGQYQASAQMQLSASVVTKANTDSGGTTGIENPENIFG
ncbi:hypothetical protein FSP39_003295 [Pinctada imbricata]|uniref:Uncharacterized protein n=1 Tax=Pinctada imbricata TaxID=66713 RepID=A0AA88Y8T7_PINIB|nr:hypothetical protein FSP39_003295 [Pinctada imbricata]